MKPHAAFQPTCWRTAASLSITIATALLFLLGPPPSEALALSCAQPSAKESADRADVVLIGAIRSGKQPFRWFSFGPGSRARAEVVVERYLKGSGPQVVTVQSSTAAWAGGWDQEDIGQRWIFFLHGEGAEYDERPCSGSLSIYPPKPEQFEVFLAEVEAVTGPGIAPRLVGEGSADYVPYWVGGVIVLVLIVAGARLAYLR